jgi:type IV secretory pathway component VirB8
MTLEIKGKETPINDRKENYRMVKLRLIHEKKQNFLHWMQISNKHMTKNKGLKKIIAIHILSNIL